MKGFQMLVYGFLKENKELTVMVVRKYNFSQTDRQTDRQTGVSNALLLCVLIGYI